MRIVASLTTMPNRDEALLSTLKSLNNQDQPLDAIYLTIPNKSRRLGIPYPELSEEIKSLCTIISIEEDYGPCSKIVGGLISESNPDTVIFSFDDDVIYPPNLVSSMMKYHEKNKDVAICSNGLLIGLGFPCMSIICDEGNTWKNVTNFFQTGYNREVDIIIGVYSVLYVRKFFPDKDNLVDEFLKYPLMDDDVYHNDDVMISGYLSSKNIKRMVYSDIPAVNRDTICDNGLSYNKVRFIRKLRLAIEKTQEWGFFNETAPIDYDETLFGNIWCMITFAALIILVCICWLYYNYIH